MKDELRSFRQSLFSTALAEVINKITHKTFRVEPVQLPFQYPDPNPNNKYVLYAHIPFCESLCPYCSFNRFVFNEDRTRSYFKALRREFRMVADKGFNFETLYIGGGTPTVLIDELTETIDLAKSLFSVKDVSCETNPNHLTPEILGELKGRVDRMSVGVQSFNDKLLKQMSRYDKFGSGEQVLEIIQNAVGILPSLNIDMIYNLPDQTVDMLYQDLDYINRSGAEQTTFYPLMSAPSVKKAMDRTLGTIKQGREIEYFQIITKELSKCYKPASAWTFSKNDTKMIDEYIVQYEEYVGTGSGAFSYLNGNLLVNTFSLGQYEKSINSGIFPVYAQKSFSKHDRMRYRFMMELFDLALDKKKFIKDYGISPELGLFFEMLFMNIAGAFGKNNANKIILKEDSRYLLVVMMREFFANVNVLRDQARFALPKEEKLMCVVNDKLYHNEFV
ncbi:MAG: coproporphyrinogen dehydrogenase [Chloroflexi bacterium HGW-Chloroflexi-8]|nr:MAG: coproporphyrinogen dehydrogenase [Chloroflexi bacterium HGW-Chloroflexi-8]